MKATHFGTCQACGRLQKAPGAMLANHGYELSHGFMNGICMGAGHLPFEISCDLVESTITSASREIQLNREIVANIRKRPASADDLLTWYQVYRPELSSRTRGSVRIWTQVRIVEENGWPHFEDLRFENAKRERMHNPGKVADIAFKHRNAYADSLERRIAELVAYIEQQRARIAAWVPRELTPVTPERKAA